MPRFRCLVGALILLSASFPSVADDDVELQIKAAYLLNFARFVEWPGARGEGSEPVIIAVLGRDPIAAALESTVKGKRIKGHRIEIRKFASPDQVDRCDILFISRAESKKARTALVGLAGKPVLTVGEMSGFLDDGGMIQFQLVDDVLRFSVNLGSAERSSFKISSELLSVAYAVTGKRK